MAGKVLANVKLLRRLRALTPPTCCGEPMVILYLDMEWLTEEQEKAQTENQEADRLAGAVLLPVWSCEKCEREEDIQGIDWPSPKTEPPAPISTPATGYRFCPHCGKSLVGMSDPEAGNRDEHRRGVDP
jgi:hypothetical protein